MAEKVKIKTKYGTISATPEQAKNWKAREEGDRVKKERISAVKENARSLNRYRQQAQTYKQQTKAREQRAAGGYDATPTNMYGQPIESFWQSAPTMPEMRPVPEVPAFPTLASNFKSGEALSFWRGVQDDMRPQYPLLPSPYSRPFWGGRLLNYAPFKEDWIPNLPMFPYQPIEAIEKAPLYR
jgi:hypothetical protein